MNKANKLKYFSKAIRYVFSSSALPSIHRAEILNMLVTIDYSNTAVYIHDNHLLKYVKHPYHHLKTSYEIVDVIHNIYTAMVWANSIGKDYQDE